MGESFFLSIRDGMMAVDVNGEGSTFRAGAIRNLFAANPWNFGRVGFDVSADGQRFVINSFAESANVPITLVINWPEELKRK